jgi:hypothetical protein
MQENIFLPIRTRLRKPSTFSHEFGYRPIRLDEGITALIGLQKGQDNLKVQTVLFNTDPSNGNTWTLGKAKEWLKINKSSIRARVFLKTIVNNIKKEPPKLLSNMKLQKSVERLQEHFNSPKMVPIKKRRQING